MSLCVCVCVCVCVCATVYVWVWVCAIVYVCVCGWGVYIFFTVWLHLISSICATSKVVCSHIVTDDKVCLCPPLLEKQGVCLVLGISLHGYLSVFARI